MAGTTKKKVKNDVVELARNTVGQVLGNRITMLPVDDIRPFHKHPFRLYEGERLQDMVESVKEHGILNPVIVRTYNGTYEMLLTVAVQLSYLPEQGQSIAIRVADETGLKLTEKIAIAVRKAPMTEKGIREAIIGEQLEPHPLGSVAEEKTIYKPIKLSGGIREKYFQGMKEKEIDRGSGLRRWRHG